MMGKRTAFRHLALVWLALSLPAPVSVLHAQERPATSAGGEQATPAGASSQANQEERDENDVYRHSARVGKMGRMFGMPNQGAAQVHG